jgi:hypothetical protein
MCNFLVRITVTEVSSVIHLSLCKVTHILVRFKRNCNFMDRFSRKKYIQILNSMKICPMETELFRADGLTNTETESQT